MTWWEWTLVFIANALFWFVAGFVVYSFLRMTSHVDEINRRLFNERVNETETP